MVIIQSSSVLKTVHVSHYWQFFAPVKAVENAELVKFSNFFFGHLLNFIVNEIICRWSIILFIIFKEIYNDFHTNFLFDDTIWNHSRNFGLPTALYTRNTISDLYDENVTRIYGKYSSWHTFHSPACAVHARNGNISETSVGRAKLANTLIVHDMRLKIFLDGPFDSYDECIVFSDSKFYSKLSFGIFINQDL